MGTAKRERQKANRQQRLEELAKEARKEKTKGLALKAGGQRQIDIPADLAYGDQQKGDVIKPGSALTFVVDVIAITPPPGSTTVPATQPATTQAATPTT